MWMVSNARKWAWHRELDAAFACAIQIEKGLLTITGDRHMIPAFQRLAQIAILCVVPRGVEPASKAVPECNEESVMSSVKDRRVFLENRQR